MRPASLNLFWVLFRLKLTWLITVIPISKEEKITLPKVHYHVYSAVNVSYYQIQNSTILDNIFNIFKLNCLIFEKVK